MIYAYTGDTAYANKAIEILNAWSPVLKEHRFDKQVYVNGKLHAAWAGETFTKAAEIIRYSHAGWKQADIARFESMLNTAFLPAVKDGWAWGNPNWNLSMAEATTNIGIFTNNRAVFDDGIDDWRAQIKGSIYLTSDGPQPLVPTNTVYKTADMNKYFNSPTRYVQGLEAETCRDLGHTAMGMAAGINVAETAYIQGIDLYKEQQNRLVAGMEYNVSFLNDPNAPNWVCSHPMEMGGKASNLTWEIGYSHYSKLGVQLPETKKYLSTHRPAQSGLHMNWETLTHGVPL